MPDLVVSVLSPTGSLVAAHVVATTVTTTNIGGASAPRSKTRVYVSPSLTKGTGSHALGTLKIGRLGPGRSITKTLRVISPALARPVGELVACADAGGAVTESHEHNNCRSAPDMDHDGWADFTDCGPGDPATHPFAPDAPDVPGFKDTNCDGIDGDASHAVFVSPLGNDTAVGTQSHPVRTLNHALSLAALSHKDVYATFGVYPETVQLMDGVSIYGGYDTSWHRASTNVTTTGSPGGATSTGMVANGIVDPTVLQLLSIRPSVATSPGQSSYGV